jgi:predicted transcriptional regulator
MGRHKKIHDQDVLDLFLENKIMTVSQLAHIAKCHPATIRSRIRSLRENGESIIPTKSGVVLVDVDTLSKELSETIYKTIEWLYKSIKGVTIIAKITKKPFKEAVKLLNLTREERQALKGPLLLISNQMNVADVEEDLNL